MAVSAGGRPRRTLGAIQLSHSTGCPSGTRCVGGAQRGPHGFECASVHLFLHALKEDVFLFPNMCLQALSERGQAIFKTTHGVLFEIVDSGSQVVVFFPQLAHQVGPIPELSFRNGEKVFFFGWKCHRRSVLKNSSSRSTCWRRSVGQVDRGAFDQPRINPCATTSPSW